MTERGWYVIIDLGLPLDLDIGGRVVPSDGTIMIGFDTESAAVACDDAMRVTVERRPVTITGEVIHDEQDGVQEQGAARAGRRELGRAAD